MNLKSHFSLCSLTNTDARRVEVGKEVYLVSKNGISRRQEILFQEKVAKHPGGVPFTNLDFHSLTLFQEKILEVTAKIYVCHGPLGRRVRFFAEYDGQPIGNFSAIASYAGGGSNGAWPKLSGPGWTVIFELPLDSSEEENNSLLVEYYTTVTELTEQPKLQKCPRVTLKEFPDGFFDTPCTIGQMEKKREVKWSIPVCENDLSLRGNLSLCHYPGFAHYSICPFLSWEEDLIDRKCTFIGKSLNKRSGLYSVEYDSDYGHQILFPWADVSVVK